MLALLHIICPFVDKQGAGMGSQNVDFERLLFDCVEEEITPQGCWSDSVSSKCNYNWRSNDPPA